MLHSHSSLHSALKLNYIAKSNIMNEWRFIDKPVFTEWLPTSTFCPLKLFQTVTY